MWPGPQVNPILQMKMKTVWSCIQIQVDNIQIFYLTYDVMCNLSSP